ncbi:class I SAM-dependent methyltransferase [Marinivivus vitaminiproducens]|uniref:class I SAM-dependent methyltransferase n=1 Tax=Marinivivus vitaminiproducens TaxID=3035935 RepID=UPI0027A47BF4|nr:class I SAM-dependent methyltransferase [Geminicoccaceae bacterium SCSIO 64248]
MSNPPVAPASERPPLRLDAETVARIREVEHLRSGGYAELDIGQTLDFYRKRYVEQIAPFRTLTPETTVADIGAGYGWLAMAFALFSPARVIAVEMDGPRLEAGREIAAILGVAERIEWHVGALGALPLPDACCDIAYCVEVLEHVQRDPGAVRDLARISTDLVILTTPNLWFPVIAHDTELPLCHWLPMSWRRVYARAFNRTDRENDNLFWSPIGIRRLMPAYRTVSGFLHYRSLDDFLGTFPFHLPYIHRGRVEKVGRLQGLYYGLAAKLGPASSYVMPNLACVLKRTGASR